MPATVFGTTFVDLVVHGKPSDDSLEAGAEVLLDSMLAIDARHGVEGS